MNKRNLLLIKIANKSPDLIVIFEILPKVSNCIIHPALFSLPGYSLYFNFNPDCDSPPIDICGVGIFISQKMHASQVFFDHVNFSDHIWVNIKMHSSDLLLVGCIYRSPYISDSVSSLCELLNKISGYTHLLICGDFNLKDITWSDYCGTSNNHHIEPFLESVDSMFLFQHVTEPTRYRLGDTPSLLDLVFTNELDVISNIT